MPLFSVVIPTFNRANLVCRAINSVLRQTFDDFEIIVVDDCSTDATRDVVKSLRDSRIRLVALTTNRGAAGARNAGIAAASGELISLLDSDDEYSPVFLQRTREVLAGTDRRIGFCWTGVEKESKSEHNGLFREQRVRRIWSPTFPSRQDAMRYCLTNDAPWGTSNGVTFKHFVFDKCGLFDEAMLACEDMDILVRLVRDFDFLVIPECLVTIHEDALQRVDGNRRNQARAWELIYERYHQDIRNDPEAVRFFHIIIAKHLRQSGQRLRSVLWAIRWIIKQPTNRSAYKLMIQYLTGLERAPI